MLKFTLFLQKLNSVVKAFASALELVITALVRQIVKNKGNTVCLQFHQVSWPVLGIPLTLHTVVALSAICTAVVIYAQV